MRLLLRKDVARLGQIGDVVEVSAGYARNYLIPQGLAVEPTKANLQAIEEQKRQAAEERARRRMALEAEAERLSQAEVTISAAANPEGHLYGSVTAREIAEALRQQGHQVEPRQVKLAEPIKQLDRVKVTVEFAEGIRAEVEVWVTRQGDAGQDQDEPDAREGPSESEQS